MRRNWGSLQTVSRHRREAVSRQSPPKTLLRYGPNMETSLTEKPTRIREVLLCVPQNGVLSPKEHATDTCRILAELGAPFVETMRARLRAENTPACSELAEQLKSKVDDARAELEGDPFLERRETWSAAMYSRRHFFAGHLMHGFHHQLCDNENCYNPEKSCACECCGLGCYWHHAIMCKTRPELNKLGSTCNWHAINTY